MSGSPSWCKAGLQSPSGRVGARRGGPNHGPMSQARDGGGPMVGPISVSRPMGGGWRSFGLKEAMHRAPEPTNLPRSRQIGFRRPRIGSRDDEPGSGARGSSAERTRRAPQQTLRFLKPTDEVLRRRLRLRREQPGSRAGAWTAEAAARPAALVIRAAKVLGGGSSRWWGAAERTPPDAELPDAPRSGRLGGRIGRIEW
jgi:hypothetical protein